MSKVVTKVLDPSENNLIPLETHQRQKGILLESIQQDGILHGEPGQVIRFFKRGDLANIRINNDCLIPNASAHLVIPYDPDFSPWRIYLYLYENYNLAPHSAPNVSVIKNLFLLAKNTIQQFPHHNLHEELLALACQLSFRLEAQKETASGCPQSLTLCSVYLRQYPRGQHRDPGMSKKPFHCQEIGF